MQAHSAGVIFSRCAQPGRSTASLSATPWWTCAMPSSRQRTVTIGERRPEITASATPALRSCMSP